MVLRLSKAPYVSIATIRGRTRGAGNELALACDLRYASREKALFGQPRSASASSPAEVEPSNSPGPSAATGHSRPS
jgi:enoyl-CoA hydratase/carnithine racemase